MNEVYILNKDLEPVGIIDDYVSLIWTKRYIEIGDCELYIKATTAALDLIKRGYFIMRLDDDMICQIERIEIDTNADNGNYIIATGYDAKRLLDQRIVWKTIYTSSSENASPSNLENYLRKIITKSINGADSVRRKFTNSNGDQILVLGDAAGFTELKNDQVTYRNVGEKIREECEAVEWGYKVVLDTVLHQYPVLKILIYKGTDKSDYIIFADEFGNINESKYIVDYTNMGNTALVGGEGEGSDRARYTCNHKKSGFNRYEKFVDAKDISRTTTWGELTELYPNGSVVDKGGNTFVYEISEFYVVDVDHEFFEWVQETYPTGTLIPGNPDRYKLEDIIIADGLPSATPSDDDSVRMWDIIYIQYLCGKGFEALSEFGKTKSFEGTVFDNEVYKYGVDYFLGDIVKIQNSYGVSTTARIIEVCEVNDQNGYSVVPKFEYKNTINE